MAKGFLLMIGIIWLCVVGLNDPELGVLLALGVLAALTLGKRSVK